MIMSHRAHNLILSNPTEKIKIKLQCKKEDNKYDTFNVFEFKI